MATLPQIGTTSPTTNYLSNSFMPTLSTALPTQQTAQSTPTTTKPLSPITSPTTNSTLQGYTNPNVNYFQQPSTFQPALTTQTPQQQTPVPQTQTASMGADPNAALTQKYTSGFQQAQQTGQQAPQTTGTGSAMVNSYTGGPTPTPMINPVDQIMAEDKGFQTLLQDYQKYQDVTSQRESLVSEYQRLQKEAGLPELNAEAINMKNVIEGTEDDIRNEITKAGGFATESQVLALTGARNKGLIKNYNKLIDTIQSAQSNLSTIMGLSSQDREYADQQFRTQLDFDNQIIQYRQKMQDNARDAYNSVLKQVGYAGLLQATKGDPYQVNLIEKTLGLQSGQLQQLANYKAPTSESDQLDMDYKRAQIANTYSQINERNTNNQPINGVSPQVISKIQSSPESKTISGVLPAIQAIKAYKDAINQYGTAENLSGTGKGTLSGTYGNAIAAWKTLAGLGALSGADFALAENAIPSTGFFQRSSTMQAKLDASLQNAINQAETMTKRLSQNYPEASNLLNTQLDDVLLTAFPEKYTRGPDGQVYEIQ